MNIEESKQYLMSQPELRFYEKYIQNKLAGDFAVDLCNLILSIEKKRIAVQDELFSMKKGFI